MRLYLTVIFLKTSLQQAEKSIQFFRNINSDDRKSIDAEVERLKCQLNAESIEWSEVSKMIAHNPGKKAVIISVVLCLLNHFTGNFVLMNYTASIFQFSGSVLSPNESALVVAAIQFVATLIVPYLVERAGRNVISQLHILNILFTSK